MASAGQDIVSPIRTVKPELPLSAPSINSEPVELDSTPTSPEKMRARRASRDELLAELDGEEKEVCVVFDEFQSYCKIYTLLTGRPEARAITSGEEERPGCTCRYTKNAWRR